jgi:ketosteroid isomerase-like protein
MHHIHLFLFLILAYPDSYRGVHAQSTPQESLMLLFDGMRSGDTTGLAQLFHVQATLQSVGADEEGNVRLQSTPIHRWLNGIAKADPGTLDEQLHYTEVRTDGDLATAWTPYTFVLNWNIHHCGTNAFQFARLNGDWRILHIVDTRQREGCELPNDLPVQTRIAQLADDWHAAAARADSAAFFDALMDGAIYIGTDPGEHWTKEEFLAFAAGKAWAFTATDRHVFHDPGESVAYWDELLDTWMGTCRGTGVAKRIDGQWKIAHYTLSLTVPNDDMEAVRSVIHQSEN